MIESLDLPLLQWIQSHRIESLDGMLRFFSSATTFISIGMILVIGLLSRFSRAGVKKMFQVSIALFIAALITFSVKSLVNRVRPFREYHTIQKLSQGGGASFPSGHTLEAFAVATSVALLFRKKRIQIPVFCWAILVAYSRMALGVHYPSDVLGGLVIGIILAIGIDYGFRRWVNPP
ncbi:MAG: phosphatase PAP2 family protein [Bacteroidales bacterium]|nr:phosphatase PAP2 family protein [Bacteroidales bacterium]